jgi:hypothetical protein
MLGGVRLSRPMRAAFGWSQQRWAQFGNSVAQRFDAAFGVGVDFACHAASHARIGGNRITWLGLIAARGRGRAVYESQMARCGSHT